MVRDFLKLNNRVKMILASLSISLVFVLLLYGYFIDLAVGNIALRKDVERKVAMLNTELGDLEESYADLQRAVNNDTAAELGFIESGEVIFVERDLGRTRLTLNNGF